MSSLFSLLCTFSLSPVSVLSFPAKEEKGKSWGNIFYPDLIRHTHRAYAKKKRFPGEAQPPSDKLKQGGRDMARTC